MSDEMKCLRCDGALRAGYVPDFSIKTVAETQWIEGELQHSMWAGHIMDGKQRFKVVTYRCDACGRLESFAREPLY